MMRIVYGCDVHYMLKTRRLRVKEKGRIKLQYLIQKTPFYCLLSVVFEFHNRKKDKDLLRKRSYK